MSLIEREPFVKGDIIERRYLVEDIKRGNMGFVYLCLDRKYNQPIAIKTFDNRYLYSEKNRRSFLNEASTWIQLERHPNIVEAKYLKLIDDHPYLFLERVVADNPRGSTLKDLLFTQTIELQRILQIAIHICDGMIHAVGKIPPLVHRDLKSENILIGQDGIPKISDFGMTLSIESDDFSSPKYQYDVDLPYHPIELARRMEGTPAYASPEQCKCETLDTRSDIYSLGCILYYMTTRRLPFHRDTVEQTILAQVREQPRSPREIHRTIPDDLNSLIMVCLEKNPDNRYNSFDDVRMELVELFEFRFNHYPESYQIGSQISVDEYIDRSESFALLMQYKRAREELMKAIKLDPDNSDIYNHLGQYSYMEGEYQRALLELKAALAGMSRNASLHESMGKAYQALTLTDEAELHYREAIRLDPLLSSAYHGLIALLLKRGEADKAEALLKIATDKCEDKVPFYFRLANLYQRMGKNQEQYEYLERVIQLDPHHIESFLRLAEISIESNRMHQGEEWTEQAARCSTNSYRQLYRLGSLYLSVNNPRKAIEYWKMAAATGEGDGLFYSKLAFLLNSMMFHDDAWRFALRAEEKGEDIKALKFDIQARRLRGR